MNAFLGAAMGIWMSIQVVGCSRPASPCPPQDDRYRPSVGPENAWFQVTYDAHGNFEDTHLPDEAYCVGGFTYGATPYNTDRVFATCNGPGWCSEEFVHEWMVAEYCVDDDEIYAWADRYCPDCAVHYKDISDYPQMYVECDPNG